MNAKQIAVVCLLLIVLSIAGCTKDKLEKIGTTRTFDITSTETGTTYSMTVFYPGNEMPTTPVPVIYVLDGFWWGDMAGGLVSDLSEEGKIPKCLMVSLDYKDGKGPYSRTPDLVYPGEGTDGNAAGQKFFKFLKNELVPKIESEYTCDTTKRTLFGHSLGGLFVLYSLLDNPTHPLFTKCIAASASIGMGVNNYVFEKEIEVANAHSDLNVTLYIGIGKYVGSAGAMHNELYNRMKNRQYPNMQIGFGLFDEQHGSDPYPVFKNGIEFVFSH